jgi:protein-disulfide isomerase
MSSSVEDDEADLTRKQRREQARAKRKQLEEAEAAAAVKRTRLTQLAVVVTVVVAIIVGILLATGGGSGKHTPTTAHEKEEVKGQIATLLAGIPQHGNVLGDPKAPVTLQYFGDLECPICQEFTLNVFPTIVRDFVRPGKLKVEYRSLQTATKQPEVFKAQQVAALAAGKQNKLWPFIEFFYHEQGEEDTGYVTESYLQGLAKQVSGLDLPKWTADRNDPSLTNQLVSDAQAGANAGLTGTPGFVLGRTGAGVQQFQPNSFSDPAPYVAAIEKELKKR